MNTTIIISLLLLVVLDAYGDALRYRGYQIWHLVEAVQIAGWFVFAGLFAADCMTSIVANQSVMSIILSGWIYVLIYVLGRIWLFDLVYNLTAGKPILYVGKNDLFGKSVRWFAGIWPVSYSNVSFIVKFMALIGWVALLLGYI